MLSLKSICLERRKGVVWPLESIASHIPSKTQGFAQVLTQWYPCGFLRYWSKSGWSWGLSPNLLTGKINSRSQKRHASLSLTLIPGHVDRYPGQPTRSSPGPFLWAAHCWGWRYGAVFSPTLPGYPWMLVPVNKDMAWRWSGRTRRSQSLLDNPQWTTYFTQCVTWLH